jgi:glycosyltransferase involved in cell wall biosynthesis
MPSPRTISVLMPTFQGAEILDRVLEALARQSLETPWDFLAVDSGSTDGTVELLESWRERLGVPFDLRRIDPVEFDHGDTRNVLAAESSGELLVYLTQDAIPLGEDWLQRLAANFADESVGAAYCRNVPRSDADLLTRMFSKGDPGYATERREVQLPDNYAELDAHARRLLYNFNDVASAIRRSLWERHPFPRTWFGEDILMSRALLEAGHTVVYDAAAVVEHSHDYSPEETRARAEIDARFNAEWLDRVSVRSKSDVDALVKRQLSRDREALADSGLAGQSLERELDRARELRRAAFLGAWQGGRSSVRQPATQMLERTELHVLYVVHGFPPDTWAGTEVYTLALAREMKRRGHQVTVLARTPGEPGDEEFSLREDDFDGLRVWRWVHRLEHGRLRESYDQPQAVSAFRDVLTRERPDIVHFQHLIHTSIGLVDEARDQGLPTVMHCHDYWALCARVQLIRPDGVRCERNMGAGCYACITDRNLERIERLDALGRRDPGLVSAVARLLHKPGYADMRARNGLVTGAYAAADLRISPSRFLRDKLLASGAFDPHTFVYSDNGLRSDHALEKRPDPRGRVRFGFVGSLVWYKGAEVLLEAMRELRGAAAVLHVHGEFTPESDEHHALLAELAGDNIDFHDRFDNHRLAEIYSELDVLVVPSLWFENSPITIHEAHLLRTPVVASGIGGMAEYVRDGVDGLHFSAGDAAALARVLRRFVDEPGLIDDLSRDFPRVKTIEENARETEYRYRALCARSLKTSGSASTRARKA